MSLPYIPSPNMGLKIPIVGVDSGPDYANNINNCLTVIDSHNHGPGQGQPISPSGLSITSDLTIQGNNLTNVRTTRFISQPGALSLTGADQTCIYAAGGELWYNDAGLNQVQITQSGSVKGSAGTITGMGGTTAGAAYNNLSSTFVFTSASSIAANLDCGTVFLRLSSSGSNYYSLSPPSPLSSNATITMPPVPASGTQIVVLNNSGNMGTQTPDTVASNMTSTGANAIAASMNATGADAIAASMDATGGNSVLSVFTSIPAAKSEIIADARVRATNSNNIASTGGIPNTVSANFSTNNSTPQVIWSGGVTIQTSGRPVVVQFVPDGHSASGFSNLITNTSNLGIVVIKRNGVQVAKYDWLNTIPSSTISVIDFAPSGSPGSYQYIAYLASNNGVDTVAINYTIMAAYEL